MDEKMSKKWSTVAGEPVRVEMISKDWCAFGSELAVLRLHARIPGGQVGWSTGRNSHMFKVST